MMTEEKTITCKGRINAGHEVAEITEGKYWRIYKQVYTNWEQEVAQAKANNVPVADVIADKYNTCYAVGADIANSISLLKVIG